MLQLVKLGFVEVWWPLWLEAGSNRMGIQYCRYDGSRGSPSHVEWQREPASPINVCYFLDI